MKHFYNFAFYKLSCTSVCCSGLMDFLGLTKFELSSVVETAAVETLLGFLKILMFDLKYSFAAFLFSSIPR